MGYKVAKSYENYNYDVNKAYTKDGKMYVKATCKCDRCGGLGVIAAYVENDRVVPIPVDGGICYKCKGEKVISKEVRLYTEKEYDKMEERKVKEKEKKDIEWQEKMKAEFASKKAEWLKKNGYSKNEDTFVYFPKDSFEVKEELKESGFTFDKTLLWHIAEVPEGYEDKVVKVNFADLGEFCPTGIGSYTAEAKEKVANLIKAQRPAPTSEWLGVEKQRLYDINVRVAGMTPYHNFYGEGTIVKFETVDGNICKWFTQTCLNFSVGDELVLTGTVKELINDKYEDDAKVTILTRCKVKE